MLLLYYCRKTVKEFVKNVLNITLDIQIVMKIVKIYGLYLKRRVLSLGLINNLNVKVLSWYSEINYLPI